MRGREMKAPTDAEVVAQHLDREFLQRPHLWPHQNPVMVFVRRDHTGKGWNHTGPLTLDEGKYVVQDHDWSGYLLDVSIKVYDDVDALLADGWVVD